MRHVSAIAQVFRFAAAFVALVAYAGVAFGAAAPHAHCAPTDPATTEVVACADGHCDSVASDAPEHDPADHDPATDHKGDACKCSCHAPVATALVAGTVLRSSHVSASGWPPVADALREHPPRALDQPPKLTA